MSRGRFVRVVSLIAGAAVLAGCMFPGGADSTLFSDAKARHSNKVGGTAADTKTVEIASGTANLTVKASYSVGGSADFTLKDPSGAVKKQIHSTGGASVRDDTWYVASNPAPGTWRLEITVSGGATYTFGFYY